MATDPRLVPIVDSCVQKNVGHFVVMSLKTITASVNRRNVIRVMRILSTTISIVISLLGEFQQRHKWLGM
jgi:hypothetical protein